MLGRDGCLQAHPFRLGANAVVVMVRVLHQRMDSQRHL
jgi:plasmid stabilization system protein ParE